MPGRGSELMRAGVFLDRDGVINRPLVRAGRPHAPRSLAEFAVLPGAEQAVRALVAAGYPVVVVTNQPEVARGTVSRALVDALNERLRALLPVAAVMTCDHDDADGCGCRKPKPGLIARAARELQIDCAASYLVGDRWRDVEAGRRAGCRTLFVDHGYDEPPPPAYDHRVGSLLEAAHIILQGGAPA